ncbi:MAG TPA: hypothetical protein VF590_05370, partial [Isosphaeraceae bacterium]
ALASSAALVIPVNHTGASEPDLPTPGGPAYRVPTVPAEHRHARALLENALRYVDPAHKTIDPASGYPVEGWNQEPARGLYLRSFTQLTAIGQCLELLADVAAGLADSPHLTRERALAGLTRLVASLRHDQHDPSLAARGLLGNFLDLATGKRLGPLASDVEKDRFLEAFGAAKGEAIWVALVAKGWIAPRTDGREAAIVRGDAYGYQHFNGELAPYNDEATKQKILAILDRRVVMVVLGDNANLSASVAKAIGALLRPGIADRPEVAELRRDLERFLDDQRAGYTRLYDAKIGLFYFGWDATKDRLFGWEDLQGQWKTGHLDYLVNEFRGPATFVVARFGLPPEAIGNLGFQLKPYRMRDGRVVHALAPWDGSAFQALGLGLSLGERDRPGWREILGDLVAVEVDYASAKGLPGFLSESYTGEGTQYTGAVGIPEITVNPRPRITDAASLYTLGVAYSVAPEEVERFLAAHWPVVSGLLTDHGPWEGYNATRREAIRFQTTAHTLALVLGLLGTASENMTRYLESRGLSARLDELFAPGPGADLLASGTQVFAWGDREGAVRSAREGGGVRVRGDRVDRVGIAFVPEGSEGVNLSGGRLSLRYRWGGQPLPAYFDLKPAGDPTAAADRIPSQVFTRLDAAAGGEAEIRMTLPATPGLARIKEVVLTLTPEAKAGPIDLTITGFEVRRSELPGHDPDRPPSPGRQGTGRE